MSKVTYPLLLVNLKTYPQGTGKKALELAKICEKVMKKTDVCIAVAVQAVDIRLISTEVDVPVFSQHIDPIAPGSNTGQILAGAIKEAGAIGTLINHSENKIKLASIAKILQLTKENDLFSCVCASTAKIAGAIAALEPNCCAIEPPELIGSGISVSTAKPEIITETVDIMKKINSQVVPLSFNITYMIVVSRLYTVSPVQKHFITFYFSSNYTKNFKSIIISKYIQSINI